MKKFEHILIVSDIDGTLVGPNYMGIPERNLEKLRYFLANGGLFTLSTGRNHKEIDFVTEPLSGLLKLPISICNGSALYDAAANAFLNRQYINTERLEEAICFILDNYADKLRLHSAVNESGELFPTDGKLQNVKSMKLFKLLFWTNADAIREIHAIVSEKYGNDFTFTIAGPRNLELVPLGGSKSYQFDYLKEHYGAKMICAIGDYDNDLEMLMQADLSACPENATEAIKAVAAHTVSHCKDGALADLIDLLETEIDKKGATHEKI